MLDMIHLKKKKEKFLAALFFKHDDSKLIISIISFEWQHISEFSNFFSLFQLYTFHETKVIFVSCGRLKGQLSSANFPGRCLTYIIECVIG